MLEKCLGPLRDRRAENPCKMRKKRLFMHSIYDRM